MKKSVSAVIADPVVTIDDLRRLAVARTFFAPTTLERAVSEFGFVQADPIRAPARAQDLTLRHRVVNYQAGDLERAYTTLPIEEDFFINYGFLPRSVQALMHPRGRLPRWSTSQRRRADALLAFVRERGAVHPREVDAFFSHGTVTNYWGGASNATTHLLNAMHYRGLLRVARRDRGIRVYEAHQHGAGPADAAGRRMRVDALVDVLVETYAPLPAASLSGLVRRLRYAVPQWQSELTGALRRATGRLARARVADIDWYWPAAENLPPDPPHEAVRLLTPFDPLVWDRRRFELFWGWTYRFEAYTPAPQRKLGYYALPMLWRDRVIGWANVGVKNGRPVPEIGYVEARPPRDRAFKRELDAELDRLGVFLARITAPDEGVVVPPA